MRSPILLRVVDIQASFNGQMWYWHEWTSKMELINRKASDRCLPIFCAVYYILCAYVSSIPDVFDEYNIYIIGNE